MRQRQEIQALSRKNGRIASVAPDLFRKPALHTQGRLSFSGQATLVRPYTFLRPAKPVSAGSCRAPASSNSERPNDRDGKILTDDTTERNAVKWSQKKSADAPKQRCRTRFKPYAYRDALLYLFSSFRCFRHEVSLRRKEFKAGLTECTTVDHKSRTTDIEIPSANALAHVRYILADMRSTALKFISENR